MVIEESARFDLPENEPWALPLAWAKRRGHHEVIEVLSRHK